MSKHTQYAGSPLEQYHKMFAVSGTHRRVLEAFEEIQASGNPLTQHEIDLLTAKRPQVYAALRTVKAGEGT
jgi:hypothetical protein